MAAHLVKTDDTSLLLCMLERLVAEVTSSSTAMECVAALTLEQARAAIAGVRPAVDSEVAQLRAEVAQLKGALALGQENCDAVYADLREERDAARASHQWHYLPNDRPDEEVTVMIACEDGDVHEGYFDGGIAYHSHAGTTDRLRMTRPYAWTDVLEAPPKR
jgi:hypothetical protein